MKRVIFAFALLTGAASCTREVWHNADLQVDVRASLPPLADQVRLCVADGPSRTLGAGPDRYALPGLAVGDAVVLTVDLLALAEADTGQGEALVLARADGVTLTAEHPYQEVALDTYASTAVALEACQGCPPACEGTGGGAGAEEETWLLAVRFQS